MKVVVILLAVVAVCAALPDKVRAVGFLGNIWKLIRKLSVQAL